MGNPTLQGAIELLQEITEIEAIDADARIADIGVDSLELLEWVFEMIEAFDVQTELDESAFFEGADDITVRGVYDVIAALAVESASPAA